MTFINGLYRFKEILESYRANHFSCTHQRLSRFTLREWCLTRTDYSVIKRFDAVGFQFGTRLPAGVFVHDVKTDIDVHPAPPLMPSAVSIICALRHKHFGRADTKRFPLKALSKQNC